MTDLGSWNKDRIIHPKDVNQSVEYETVPTWGMNWSFAQTSTLGISVLRTPALQDHIAVQQRTLASYSSNFRSSHHYMWLSLGRRLFLTDHCSSMKLGCREADYRNSLINLTMR